MAMSHRKHAAPALLGWIALWVNSISPAAAPTAVLEGDCPGGCRVKPGLNGTLRAGACNGPGIDGWNWRPWTEGRTAGSTGDRWKNDEGPDSRFLIAAVRCVAKTHRLDARRLFVGGISSGGTMTNRALTFRSDFWAGGLSISGEWYVTQDDGTALSFEAAREAVRPDPTKIFQGRVGPFPLAPRLKPAASWAPSRTIIRQSRLLTTTRGAA